MKQSHSPERPIAVYGALAANLAIAITKFIAASVSQSAAMFSEAIHSTADTGNELLLLLGLRRGRRPPDKAHPFGHSQEVYFWGFVVAVLLFGLGGGMSFYEGFHHLRHPVEMKNPFWNYIVLGASFVFESISFLIGRRQFRSVPASQLWRAVRVSKDPSLFTVLVEDAAALMGLIVAFLGVLLSHHFREPLFDAAASILIGVILSGMAMLLARESKGLLLGESADVRIVEQIRRLGAEDPVVTRVDPPLTMHMGPEDILVILPVYFHDDLSPDEIAAATKRIEQSVRSSYPNVKRFFIQLRVRNRKSVH
jgi:cation diffusion facilitator family transporter